MKKVLLLAILAFNLPAVELNRTQETKLFVYETCMEFTGNKPTSDKKCTCAMNNIDIISLYEARQIGDTEQAVQAYLPILKESFYKCGVR